MAYGMDNPLIENPFWYYNLPEYQLEGIWACKIEDNDKNLFNQTANWFKNGIDGYVHSISIPQLSFGYENTDFNMINFKDKSPYDDTTISFYDDIYGTALSFFKKWMSYIYDEDEHALQYNWRYETKDIYVSYYRQFFLTERMKPSMKYLLKRCLPKSISEISAEEDGGNRKTFSVVLACQKVENQSLKENPLSVGLF